ncbi:MAG: ADP-ribosylglycohydrolase family protein [Clostridia bacterium]|nr:ADP-ribosylglycohydrolase family protein [Clostridia bacterium]
MRNLDKFKGCLVGGAAGDALGYAVEFLSESTISASYGPGGITRYANGRGLISDDTQMSMFTAAGLLLGAERFKSGGFAGYPYYIALSYGDWYGTQTAEFPLKRSYVPLAKMPEMFSRRAPGKTSLSALSHFLESHEYGTIEHRINHSKGCGGVMRAAPVGLFFAGTAIPVWESDIIAAQSAALTHGHGLGWLPAALLAHIVRLLAEDAGETVLHAVEDASKTLAGLFPDIRHTNQMLARIKKAVDLAANLEIDDLTAIHKLGEGWVGDEALAVAVFCALRHSDDMEAALIAAVNHGGDSDSTGAICGNIMGALFGYDAIPAPFKTNLELHDTLCSLAEQLYGADVPADSYAVETKKADEMETLPCATCRFRTIVTLPDGTALDSGRGSTCAAYPDLKPLDVMSDCAHCPKYDREQETAARNDFHSR